MIDRVLAGDDEAFRILTQRYANYVFRIAYGVLQNAKDAEDAAQEAFVQMYLSLPRYERKGLKAWLARIAVNKAIDWKRKVAGRKEMPLPDAETVHHRLERDGPAAVASAERAVLDRERREEIARNLHALPENYRSVIVAYYLEEKSYREIAAELGVEVKTVESRLYRAKQWMRKHWREDDG